jgi:hypothetical protein
LATPELVEVWVGLDMGKDEHFAEVLDDDGRTALCPIGH